MPLEQEFDEQQTRNIIRAIGGIPNGKFPANPRAGTVNNVLRASATQIGHDISRFKLRHPPSSYTGTFFNYNKRLAQKIHLALATAHDDIKSIIDISSERSWELANDKNTAIIQQATRGLALTASVESTMNQLNLHALNSFLTRTEKGFTLSERIWLILDGNQEKIEQYLSAGIMTGRSAGEISRDIRKLLVDPDMMFRRKRNPLTDRFEESERSKAYHPGQGKYKSSYKNALRLTATEINMAYRLSDFERRKQLPIVKGVRVNLSAAHPRPDICDSLQGPYPKGFYFSGWHPLCYSEDKEVYTHQGWKLFKDVTGDELVMSLNPKTKNLEYTHIVNKMQYKYDGDMLRFHNHSFDMLVTPDHEMVGFQKDSGKLRQESANAFYENLSYIKSRDIHSSNNALYRSSEWIGYELQPEKTPFEHSSLELYCKLMGWYLSEGSTSRKYAIAISQNFEMNKKNYKEIKSILTRLGMKFKSHSIGFAFYNQELWEYLKPFGKSYEKCIPVEIKRLPIKYLEMFLDAYCKGDGNIKAGKNWKGGKFKDSRTFSTSSKRMAGDLGELILKIGHHPSFRTDRIKGKLTTHKNGTFASNHDQIIISDCSAKYVRQMHREKIPYNGTVYDIELERNHIMYVRRNGKCVWGSNCICFTTSILYKRDDIRRFIQTGHIDARQKVRSIPRKATRYIEVHKKQFDGWKSLPLWADDNFTSGWNLKKKVTA